MQKTGRGQGHWVTNLRSLGDIAAILPPLEILVWGPQDNQRSSLLLSHCPRPMCQSCVAKAADYLALFSEYFISFPQLLTLAVSELMGTVRKCFELVDQGKGAKGKGPRGCTGDWTRETGTEKGPVSHLNLLWEGMLNSAVINWSHRRFSLWLARLQRRNTGFKCCTACWYSFYLT